jgi:hypothetical protein
MARVFDGWESELVPERALAVADREAELHLARWEAGNDELAR